MRFDLDRPDLADTPELFSRVEANLMREAANINDRRMARHRRSRWYESLRPALTAGAAFAALVVLFPLTQSGITTPPTTAPAEQVVDDHLASGLGFVTAESSHRERLPAEDLADPGRTSLWPDRVS